MNISLPDGSILDLPAGSTGHDAAAAIGPGLAKAALAVKVDDEIRDLARPLEDGDAIEVVTKKSGDDFVWVMRHSAAHVLAEAVLKLFPGTKFGFGPPIENGFYYDFEFPEPITDEDFPAIEKEMRRIIKSRPGFERSVMSMAEAREYFGQRDDTYKVDQVNELESQGETEVSIYRQGDFVDLCRGPHLRDAGQIGATKVLSVAGAYWRGDEKNTQLTRLYATAFPTAADLDAHLEQLEAARARDHRRVGKDLELFHFDDAAPGMPFFLPKGMVVLNLIQAALREELDALGYEEVKTPAMLSDHLWHESGHYEHYKDNMYFTEVEGQGFAVKPMNCPGAVLVFRSTRHSYRDLPIRLAEFGHVHRHELSGSLHGLFRVRAFTQDDAHVFCRPDQIQEEVTAILELTERFYGRFGFDSVQMFLSTRPEKASGTAEMWDGAEEALRQALGDREYGLKEGDGAFYGPKIDFQVTDTMGRSWQLGTVQLDFFMPERFDISYITADDDAARPVMIHRAITGSLERFLGILIEDSGGDFPFWLAPVQIRVLPISDRHAEHGQGVVDRLKAAGIRAELDDRTESVGRRIREGELAKLPYLGIVGDRELEDDAVSLRARGGRDDGAIAFSDLVDRLLDAAS